MALEEPLFSELLQRLHGEKGMRRKVRLLAGSWSLLHKLSPQQREHLGLAIGNRWAWRNIESLFGNPARLSENQREVKEFFDSMRETDPEDLRQIASRLTLNGNRRDEELQVDVGDAIEHIEQRSVDWNPQVLFFVAVVKFR